MSTDVRLHLASSSRTLYIGITNNLARRLSRHREVRPGSFAIRYSTQRLVHAEPFEHIHEATAREKYLKHCTRAEKLAAITCANPPGSISRHPHHTRSISAVPASL